MGWIGVDLDGTLAEYAKWEGPDHIGAPVQKMLSRVKKWLKDGEDVRVFTARASVPDLIPPVQEWCRKYVGQVIPVTNVKDFACVEVWDDRCVQIEMNTGERADGRGD